MSFGVKGLNYKSLRDIVYRYVSQQLQLFLLIYVLIKVVLCIFNMHNKFSTGTLSVPLSNNKMNLHVCL